MASFVITVDTLLQGAWYSLKQAGRLLVMAVTVFEAGDFSTATGLAMFGREELGRYSILRNLADEVARGHSMTAADVQARCDDHEDKQRAAMMSTTLRANRGTQIGDAVFAQMIADPHSTERNESGELLKIVTDAMVERTPSDRHRLRMRSFYVDINRSGLGWSRPIEITATKARSVITDAVNDYNVQMEHRQSFPDDDPVMTEALKAMNPKPDPPFVHTRGL